MSGKAIEIEPHVDSYYVATAIGMREYAPLDKSATCDVCVTGGGFTGVSAALNLAERGYRVILLEANRIGWGASGRNGGQMGSGMVDSQSDLEELYGFDKAQQFWTMCEKAKKEVLGRIERHDIQCHFKPGVVGAACTNQASEEFHAEVEDLHKNYDYRSIRYLNRNEVGELLGTDLYYGGRLDMGAGHLHPLNYILGLAKAATQANVQIYEKTRVLKFTTTADRVAVQTSTGVEVRAKYLILACNGYLKGLSTKLENLLMPLNSYIVATEPLEQAITERINKCDVAVFDSRFDLDYYRLSSDKRLLFGGGGSYTRRNISDIRSRLRRNMLIVYPELSQIKIDYAWGGLIAMTVNEIPVFGKSGENVFYAHGFSGHGLALSNFAGKLIAEAIEGSVDRFNIFADVKHRAFPGGKYLRWPVYALRLLYYAGGEQIEFWRD